MIKIYISGKISGLPLNEAKKAFQDAEEFIKKRNEALSRDVEIFNPFKVCKDLDPNTATWEDYMVKNIEALLTCDSIYMLSNWEDSRGAKVEYAIAQSLGLSIFHQLKRV